MKKIVRLNKREDWLQVRGSGIGSSEVATIIGLNPWQTPYMLWRRKTGRLAEQPQNFLMKAGHYLEDAVARFWQDETGRQVIKRSAGDWLVICCEHPHRRVSPDRTYWLDSAHPKRDDNKGILECKTTQKAVDPDDIPPYWFCQLQYQLGVAEVPRGSLAWLSQGRDFGYKDVEFVPSFFEYLIEEVDRFWIDCVQGGKEPAPINAEDVYAKYPLHEAGKVVPVGEEAWRAYQQLKAVREELESLDERKKALEDSLKILFGNAEEINYDGQVLATWRAAKPSAKFNQRRFAEENPDMVLKYTEEQAGSRRFLLK